MKHITMFGFFAVTVAMTMDIHEYPVFATSGLHLIFFLVAGAILWFIPTALCSAELATVENWNDGGIFVWVKNTLGKKLGFVAIFLQWLQITVGFTAMLYFIIGIFADSFGFTIIDENPLLKCLVAVLMFWGMSLLQLKGSKHTILINKVGLIAGIIVPSALMAILSIAYLLLGGHSNLEIIGGAILPDLTKLSTIVIFVTFIFSYMGIEASASYANELKNPKRNYPIVILMVAFVAILLNMVGGLSIAVTVPNSDLSLNAGIVQSMMAMLGFFGLNFGWLIKIFSAMIAIGVLSELSGWLVGPIRGLQQAAEDGILPVKYAKVNKYNVPVRLLFMQGIVATVWITLITLIGGGDNLSFMIAITATVVIYGVAYLLMYTGYFNLIFKQKKLERRFEVPGGLVGKTIIAGVGIITTAFCMIISFVPASSMQNDQILPYFAALIPVSLIAIASPFVIYAIQNKRLKIRK